MENNVKTFLYAALSNGDSMLRIRMVDFEYIRKHLGHLFEPGMLNGEVKMLSVEMDNIFFDSTSQKFVEGEGPETSRTPYKKVFFWGDSMNLDLDDCGIDTVGIRIIINGVVVKDTVRETWTPWEDEDNDS